MASAPAQSARHSVLWLVTPLGLLAAFGLPLAVRLPAASDEWLLQHPQAGPAFLSAGIPGVLNVLAIFSVFAALVALAGFAAGFTRRPWALGFIRKCLIVVAAWVFVFLYAVLAATGVISDRSVLIDDAPVDTVRLFYWRWDLCWPAAMVFLWAVGLYIYSWRRHVIEIFRPPPPEPVLGDQVVENLRTHGKDPRYRRSLLQSFGYHIAIIILLPWLLQLSGCVEPYRVPKGSGNPVVALVKIVKPKPKEKKKKYLVNPNSPISFYIPQLDDSDVQQKVDEMTQLTYVANASRVVGKMGAGGGKKGGWPDGMDKAVVRFIRLEYSGRGWDDGMDSLTRADVNFLTAFRRMTGFKVAAQGESHPISSLKKYPKGFAPPFVYITGDGSINVAESDVKILRDYLQDGGMLFADCGSPQWHTAFRSFIGRVLPGNPLLTIADDDPIFQAPFTFANGAPPLWHHGGRRALGVKYKNRWVVFYHPGDINDAWKTGHSGLDPRLADGAIEMGVNIVYYSFTHYLELTRKYRK
ncbi:MAG: hypothetical protein PCFJNLEI_02255 [Verrucomicrobiae bacterium]|nr:hypothetical protein [Verrucomicrobiae bacterium]